MKAPFSTITKEVKIDIWTAVWPLFDSHLLRSLVSPSKSQARFHRDTVKLIVGKFSLCITERHMKAIYSWESRKMTTWLCVIFSNFTDCHAIGLRKKLLIFQLKKGLFVATIFALRMLQSNTKSKRLSLKFYDYQKQWELFVCFFFSSFFLLSTLQQFMSTTKTRQTAEKKTILSYNLLSIISTLASFRSLFSLFYTSNDLKSFLV